VSKATNKAALGMLAGIESGKTQALTDARLEAENLQAREVAFMRLDDILGRVGSLDTRQPTPEDVDALADSVNALGLLEPLVVDSFGRLLAGKTRLLALRRLKLKDPDRWERVPVRKMPFDADEDRARALAVEVAENEQRRDYTNKEIKALAARLQAAGFRATAGRPRKGEKALLPALGAVVGKSKRALLYALEDKPKAETVQSCTILDAPRYLRALRRPVDNLTTIFESEKRQARKLPNLTALRDAVFTIHFLLDAAMEELETGEPSI